MAITSASFTTWKAITGRVFRILTAAIQTPTATTTWTAANWPAIDTTCNNHTDPGQFWNWNHFMDLINTNASFPPTITNQPQGLTVLAGQNATFTVAASGTEPLHFQWRFGGNNIP